MSTFRPYEPRRRALSAREHREVRARHRRAARRNKVGLFTLTFLLTIGVAAAGLGLRPASTDDFVTTQSALQSAHIEPVTPPVKVADKEVAPVAETAAAVDGPTPADSAQVDEAEAVPKESGTGRRVIFSISAGRVWLVDDDGEVARTYRASGSIHDNLRAGSFRVQSRTRHATSYDYESTMEYFVRFTEGKNAPIGFHDIPVDTSGALIQTVEELGTALSAGCIRQERTDAIELWNFAPVGTPVEVLS